MDYSDDYFYNDNDESSEKTNKNESYGERFDWDYPIEDDYKIEKIPENNNYKFIGKPKNCLDLLNYSGEEYDYSIMKKKINQKLSQFNFEPKIKEEIIKICFFYRKKIKFYRLFPLVLFKIIKKYKYPIPLKTLKKTIKFNMNDYFKNSNNILIESFKNNDNFENIILSYINEYINKLIKLTNTNPRIFKKKSNKKGNLNLTQNINHISSILINSKFSSKNCFSCYEIELNKVKEICKDKIYGNRYNKTLINVEEESDFETFFSGKIQYKTLALSLIRYVINENCDFSISLKNFHQIFDIWPISITKGEILIKEYLKIINNENK